MGILQLFWELGLFGSAKVLTSYLLFCARPSVLKLFDLEITTAGSILTDEEIPSVDIPYWHGAKRYVVRVPLPKRGPTEVQTFECVFHDGSTVTDPEFLMERLGPYKNFHEVRTTPRLLGFSKIEVSFPLSVRDDLVFETDDVLEW